MEINKKSPIPLRGSPGFCWDIDSEDTPPKESLNTSFNPPSNPRSLRSSSKRNKKGTSTLRDRDFLQLINLADSSGVVESKDILAAVSTGSDLKDSDTVSQSNSTDEDSELPSGVYIADNGQLIVSHGHRQEPLGLINFIRRMLQTQLPSMEGLYSAFYAPGYDKVRGGNSPSAGRYIAIGYNVRIFFKSYRLMPGQKPRRIPYKLRGTLSQLEEYLETEKELERHREAFKTIGSILSSSEHMEPVSPAFERLAAAFFNGEEVLDPEHYESEKMAQTAPNSTKRLNTPQSTSKPGSIEDDALLGQDSTPLKKYQIVELGGDWAKVLSILDETKILNTGVFFGFLRDLVMNNELKIAARRRTSFYGLKVFPQTKVTDEMEKTLDTIEKLESGELSIEDTDWADMANTFAGADSRISGKAATILTSNHAQNGGIKQAGDTTLDKSHQHSSTDHKSASINPITDSSTIGSLKPTTKTQRATTSPGSEFDWSDEDRSVLKFSTQKRGVKKGNKKSPGNFERNERSLTEEAASLDSSHRPCSENGDPSNKFDTEASGQINPAIETATSAEMKLSDRILDPDDDGGWNVVQPKEKRKPITSTTRSESYSNPNHTPTLAPANQNQRLHVEAAHSNVSRSIHPSHQTRNPLYQNPQQRQSTQSQNPDRGQIGQGSQPGQPSKRKQVENKQQKKAPIIPSQNFKDGTAAKTSMAAKTAPKQVQTERVYNPADYPAMTQIARSKAIVVSLPTTLPLTELDSEILEAGTSHNPEGETPDSNLDLETSQDLVVGSDEEDRKSASSSRTPKKSEVHSDNIKASKTSSDSSDSVSTDMNIGPQEDSSAIDNVKNGNSDDAIVEDLASLPGDRCSVAESLNEEIFVDTHEEPNQAIYVPQASALEKNLGPESNFVEVSAHPTLSAATGTADGDYAGISPSAESEINPIHNDEVPEGVRSSGKTQNDATKLARPQPFDLDTEKDDSDGVTGGSGGKDHLTKATGFHQILPSLHQSQSSRQYSQNRPATDDPASSHGHVEAQHEYTKFTSSKIPLRRNQYLNGGVSGNGYQSSYDGSRYTPSEFYPPISTQHLGYNATFQHQEYCDPGLNQTMYSSAPSYTDHGHPAFNGDGGSGGSFANVNWRLGQSHFGTRSYNPASASRTPYDDPSRNTVSIAQTVFTRPIWCTYCRQPVVQHNDSPLVLCPGCGPMCNIHYCSVACLLVDSLTHSASCMQNPASQSIMPQVQPAPSIIYELDPIYPLDGFLETPARQRQKLFSIYCSSGPFPKLYKAWSKISSSRLDTPGFDENESMKKTGHYTVFRSEVTGAASRDNPNAEVLFSIKLDKENPMRQALIRALNACFLCLDPRIVGFLYHLILDLILSAEVAPSVATEFHTQFREEFGLDGTVNAHLRHAFDFQREWTEIEYLLLHLEDSHPVLRRWLVKSWYA